MQRSSEATGTSEDLLTVFAFVDPNLCYLDRWALVFNQNSVGTIEAEGNRGVHGPQRGPVSITQVTERGSVYALAEIEALADAAIEALPTEYRDADRRAQRRLRNRIHECP